MGKLVLGLQGIAYYNGFSPFLDWTKGASQWLLYRNAGGDLAGDAIWTAGGYLDDDGQPITPAPSDVIRMDRYIFTQPPAVAVAAGLDYSGEQFVATWTGGGTVVFAGSVASQSSPSAGRQIMTVGDDPSFLTYQVAPDGAGNMPQNIKVFQARYETNVDAGETFNPDWLEAITPFWCHRCMDWQLTNYSLVEEIADLADEDYHAWGQSDADFGPKGGMPLSVIASLANETGVRPWICIPYGASDALVLHMAEFFRNNLNPGIEVIWELSNEPWNTLFPVMAAYATLGTAIWGDLGGPQSWRYYGFRAAQCAKIIRDAYNDRSRWRMVLGAQTTYTAPFEHTLVGVQHWITENSSPLAVSDLFDHCGVTNYFGEVPDALVMTGITKANPAVATIAGHPYSNGDELYLIIPDNSMVELDETYATVANKTTDAFELSGVNSTGFSTFAAGDNLTVPSKIYRLMDESESRFGSNPSTYPTKYTYFNQQVRDAFIHGTCDFGYSAPIHLDDMRDTYWPAHKALAEAVGLTLICYEGGNHFVGDIQLTANGGEPRFTEWMIQFGYSPECAEVYATAYLFALRTGIAHAAKFVEAGQISQYGTWAGIRFWPLAANDNTDDTGNPVWQATLRANAGFRAMTLT